MRDALRYEWMRIRTVRSTYWLTGAVLAIAALTGFLVALAVRASGEDASADEIAELGPWIGTQFAAAGSPYFVAYLLAIIGILGWGHEYRHGMIRATLTAVPSRSTVFWAKQLVVGGWVALSVAAAYTISVLGAWLVLRGSSFPLPMATAFDGVGRATVYTVLLTWLGMAATSLLRNQTASMVLLFIWPLVVENVVKLVVAVVPGTEGIRPLTRFLPFDAGGRINSDTRLMPGESVFGQPLTWIGGVIVFGGVTLVLVLVALVLFRRRDA